MHTENGLFAVEEIPRQPTRTPDLIPVDTVEVVREKQPSGDIPRLPIEVHRERVEQVLGALVDAYSNNNYPYNLDRVRVPQHPDHMPPSLELGTKEHAMFLWTSCYYMRGGIKSVDAFKRLGAMYEAAPGVFDASISMHMDPEEIALLLKKYQLGFQDAVSKQWVENAGRLMERCDGDPRAIFDSIGTYDEALSKIKNDHKGNGYLGFQEKMTSMIIYFLMDEKLIEAFNFPIPIDLHVMRISIANELITFPGVPHGTNLYRPETLATLRTIYEDYSKAHDVDALRLCDAVWLFSEAMCSNQPGNITLEPEGRHNRNGRSTVLIPLEVDPYSETQRDAFKRTCGRCVLRDVCKWNIPGKPYYVQGHLGIRGPRKEFEPLQGELF